MNLDQVYNELKKGNLSVMTRDVVIYINNLTLEILTKENMNPIMDALLIHNIELIILISNIIYNNADCSCLPLEDEVYDKLQNVYKTFFPNSYSIGAPPVDFGHINENLLVEEEKQKTVFPFIVPEIQRNEMMFPDTFLERHFIDYAVLVDGKPLTKRLREVAHLHPSLAGTLDKCNFVLNRDAFEAGINLNKTDTQIFEKDFLSKVVKFFGLNPIPLVMMLKYDGVAVEADCSDTIVSARTRGDTGNDATTDITPILEGYVFPNAKKLDVPVGVQFEAIIDYHNLARLNELTGKNYVNGRTAIIGLLGSSEARKYRDFITLVPVDADLPGYNKIERLEFCNQFYATRIKCIYQYVCAQYDQLLFLVHKFVYEAEKLRSYLPFMYDGVVTELIDPNVVKALGRVNNVNKYMMAIKFNAVKKYTRFLGYTFSVGQNGEIVPLLHYLPVSLMGTIHTKTTGHSYKRFKELELRPDDIIQIEYRNDVIPYASKPMIPDNSYNPNPPISFPTHCPSCGTQIYFTEKQAYCTNVVCPARVLGRVTNMIDRLGIRDISEERVKDLGVRGFAELMELPSKKIYEVLGEAIGEKLIEQINGLKFNPIEDYKVVGSIGFSGLAQKSWKAILNVITLDELMYLNDLSLYNRLIPVKGIGKETINTITSQRQFFIVDLDYIQKMSNVIRTTGICNENSKKICTSGFRLDNSQINFITAINKDVEISDGSVTKDTSVLIVPMEGYQSGKVKTANKYNIPVVPINLFMANPRLYI